MLPRVNSKLDRQLIMAAIVCVVAAVAVLRSAASNSPSEQASAKRSLRAVGSSMFTLPGKGKARLDELVGNLPLAFEANVGQADKRVKFVARGAQSSLCLNSNGATLRPYSTRAPVSFSFIG